MTVITIDMGIPRQQVRALVPAGARLIADAVPKGSVRANLTPEAREEVVIPLALFVQERERQLARRLNQALAALFRTLVNGQRGASAVGPAILAFEQHGFTAADFARRLGEQIDGHPYSDPLTQADAITIVLRGVVSAMPASRLALGVLSFALDSPVAARAIGREQHLFDAYARIVLHAEIDDGARFAGLSRMAIRSAIRDRLQPEGFIALSLQERMTLAFDRQVREDEIKLFAEIVAPTVIKMSLIILSVLPVGWLGRSVRVFQAVIGFFQFLELLFESKDDGQVSREDATELRWAALGIVPFLPLQLLVAGRAVGGLAIDIGSAALEHIEAATTQLLDEMPLRSAAAEAGFEDACVIDPEFEFFIPEGFEQ